MVEPNTKQSENGTVVESHEKANKVREAEEFRAQLIHCFLIHAIGARVESHVNREVDSLVKRIENRLAII